MVILDFITLPTAMFDTITLGLRHLDLPVGTFLESL